ncbi:hypothetical protein ACIREO_23240 [Streptomyces sp. NPDC102441]
MSDAPLIVNLDEAALVLARIQGLDPELTHLLMQPRAPYRARWTPYP